MAPSSDALHLWVPEAELELAIDRLWQSGVVGIEERWAVDGVVELVTAPDPADAEFWTTVPPTLPWEHQRRAVDVGAALDAWRPHARTSTIAGVAIRPVWIDPPATSGEPVLDLEPGRAWGHGAHPSTVLAGELLVAALADRPSGATVLDVGCGSGVLSLLAAHFGALVTALDTDPEARRVTADNAERNGLDRRVRVRPDASLGAAVPAEVVVANVGAGVLAELADELVPLVAPTGGALVLSGLLATQVEPLARASFVGWEITARLDDPPWVAVALRRI